MIPKRTRRLRARAAALHPHDDFEDYGPEPNMKLSHAFLVVLLLHVVAVGGLYAFNSMKAGRQASLKTGAGSRAETAATAPETTDREVGGGGPGGAGKPPEEEEKPAPVAKTGAPEKPAARPVSEKAPSAPKGLLAGLRNALHKTAAPAAVSTAAVPAVAQETGLSPTTDAGTPVGADTAHVGKTYLVKAGDTVTRIASELGVALPDLEKVNGLQGNSVLQVGQTLKVPETLLPAAPLPSQTASQAGVSGAPSPGTLPATTAGAIAATVGASDQGTFQDYTIVKGDNPYKLAKKFHITPEELMKANGITDPKKIQIGQKLKIPAPVKKSK